MAVPSDMYVQGYDGKGVAKLRLWQAKAPDFDMSSFSLGNYNTAMSKNAKRRADLQGAVPQRQPR